jgi:hypothetical protein
MVRCRTLLNQARPAQLVLISVSAKAHLVARAQLSSAPYTTLPSELNLLYRALY